MYPVHPLIRIICFMVLATSLTQAVPMVLLLVATAFFLFGLVHRHSLLIALQMVRRLRWLLLSIVLIYLWMTPGTPLFPLELLSAITREGLYTGMLRVASLALIVIAVQMWVLSLPAERLYAALYQLALPFSYLGLSRTRLAVRMMLVLQVLGPVKTLLNEHRQRYVSRDASWRETAELAADVFVDVVKRADQAELHTVSFEVLQPPAVVQWLYPLMIVVVLAYLMAVFPV